MAKQGIVTKDGDSYIEVTKVTTKMNEKGGKVTSFVTAHPVRNNAVPGSIPELQNRSGLVPAANGACPLTSNCVILHHLCRGRRFMIAESPSARTSLCSHDPQTAQAAVETVRLAAQFGTRKSSAAGADSSSIFGLKFTAPARGCISRSSMRRRSRRSSSPSSTEIRARSPSTFPLICESRRWPVTPC